jgi:chromosome segregation ATPase
MPLTQQQVFDAANELNAAGQKPTLAAVRRALGSGSFTTISEGLRAWREQQLAQHKPVLHEPPPDLLERLSELGAQLWTQALAHAQGTLAAERQTLAQAREQLEQDKAEATELAESLQLELETLQSDHKQQVRAAATLQAEVAQCRTELQQSKADSAQHQARLEEVRQRADDLNAELQRVGALNATLSAALAARAQPGAAPLDGQA